MPGETRRFIVAGVSGAGKTTLARRMSRVSGIPHVEIDSLFHGPGWTPREAFLDDVRALIARESWITEWQYSSARSLLAERAQVLVWVDLPFLTVTLPRLVRRTLRRRFAGEELWNGNVEPPLHTFFTDREHIVRWAWATRKMYRTRVPQVHAELEHLTVVHLRSRSDVERWLRRNWPRAGGPA